jgi:hypothetical protein
VANKFLQRLRESVAASTQPQLQRGTGDKDKLEESAPTQAERDKAAAAGDAFSDGSFPITTQKQADDAWSLRGHNENHSEQSIVAHIRKQVEKHDLNMPGDPARTKESVSLHNLLREAAIRQTAPGVYEATIIQEGCGNPKDANYYTKDALREAVNAGKFEGLRAYLNHPTATEERDRPERDVRFLAGHFKEAKFIDGNPARVDAKFVAGGMEVDKVRNLLESAINSPVGKPLVGISIDGYGAAPDKQTVNGRTYNMVREIAHLGSADIVTQTATGGRFRRALQEASLTPGSISRPVTSKEDKMTFAEFQQKVKAANAKLVEAFGLDSEKDGDKAEGLLREGLVLLRECNDATVDPEIKIQEKIVEKPVAASGEEKDHLAASLKEAQDNLTATETKLRESEDALKASDEKLGTLEAGQAALKVMRDKKVPDAFRESWFPEVAAQKDEDAMSSFVDRKLQERDAILAEFRESVGVEGAGLRPSSSVAAAGSDDQVLAALGIDKDYLAA